MRGSAATVFTRISAADPPAAPQVTLGRAVVMGGSIAGLLAARVLADHAESVLVIDRDAADGSGGPRDPVPQGTQIHVLLPAGQVQLERWFPGFTAQAVAAGACLLPAAERRQYVDGRRRVQGSDRDMLSATRPFLEELIRRRVRELPNVRIVGGRVTGVDVDAAAVTGVHHESAGGAGVEAADFVVDAMGRSSRLGEWLAAAGWQRPTMTRMTVDINYATAMFHRGARDPEIGAVLAGYTGAAFGDLAGAVLSPVEGDRWMVMMGGYGHLRPGHTAADLVRRCHRDFPPEFAAVAGNEMIDDVRTYRQADSRRRNYHQLQRLPARLVVVGDAVSSFNPIYGQGMASAALHAACLSLHLRSAPDPRTPAREFFALQRVVVDAAWGMSTSADLSRPSVAGPYPRGYRLSRWVGDQIFAASVVDATICRRLEDVTQMMRHPSTLATPGALLRAWRVNRRVRRPSGATGRG